MSNVSPQGYMYGSAPNPTVPFWETGDNITEVTASAEVDSTTGTPSVDLEVSQVGGHANINFSFSGLKGAKGDKGDTGATGATGATGPQGPQGIQGIQGETGATGPQGPQGIQGETGATGATGPQGPAGQNGTDGVTPVISATATVDGTSSQNPTCTVTKTGTDAAPSFQFSFSGIKGADGQGGGGSVTIPDLEFIHFTSSYPLKTCLFQEVTHGQKELYTFNIDAANLTFEASTFTSDIFDGTITDGIQVGYDTASSRPLYLDSSTFADGGVSGHGGSVSFTLLADLLDDIEGTLDHWTLDMRSVMDRLGSNMLRLYDSTGTYRYNLRPLSQEDFVGENSDGTLRFKRNRMELAVTVDDEGDPTGFAPVAISIKADFTVKASGYVNVFEV